MRTDNIDLDAIDLVRSLFLDRPRALAVRLRPAG